MATRLRILFLFSLLFVTTTVVRLESTDNPSVTGATQSSPISTTVKISEKPTHAGHSHNHDPGTRGNETANGMSFRDLVTNKDALMRSFYVFGALCVMVMFYFAFRALRLRRRRARRTGTRKYRPLNPGNGHEMEPLDAADDNEEDDEDTLFDSNQPRQPI